VEIKCQLDATDWFLLAKLIVRSTCFGHHYAQHVATSRNPNALPTAPHQTNDLQTKVPRKTGSNHLYNS